MFDTICTLPLPADLFSQAVHPSEPILSIGLVSGHVETFRLPDLDDDSPSSPLSSALLPNSNGNNINGRRNSTNSLLSDKSNGGTGMMSTLWKTRRHQGSCRTLGFGTDGAQLYSAGTDGLVKVADTATGRVVSKIATPVVESDGTHEPPSLLHALTPSTLLLATDTSSLHLYDIRTPLSLTPRPSQTHHPHPLSYISSLTPLPPSASSTTLSPKQFLTTGGLTLALTDLRRGVLVVSEAQDEELVSSAYAEGFAKRGTSTGRKALVGGADGVLSLWEHGVWDDLDERIYIDKDGGSSIDVLRLIPSELSRELEGAGARPMVAAGLDDGSVRLVQLGKNKVVSLLRHDDVERVAALDFDVGGRMVSGGGQVLKVWYRKMEGENDAGDVEDEEDEDGEEDDEIEGSAGAAASKRRKNAAEDEEDSDDEEESSDEDKKDKKKRKKRKRGKKEKNPTGHRNGILGFKGLD